jgi:hypothetical protein
VGVKYLRGRWLGRTLLGLLIVLGSLLLSGRSRVESQGGSGIVEVAFQATLSTFDGSQVAQDYQHVQLNVVRVRLNPIPGATDSDTGWVEIPAPAAVGTTNPTQFINTSLNFSGSGTLLTAANSELQMDLVPIQNLAFFFNAGTVPAQNYGQVEVVLDSNVPGNMVPLCNSSGGQGCVSYLANLTPAAELNVPFSSVGYSVATGVVQQLLININEVVGTVPPGGPNSGAVAIQPVIFAQGALPPLIPSSALGVVTGTVANGVVGTTTVTAENAGTNQAVAATQLLGAGNFIFDLPALSAQQGGTPYDFYVSGSGTYAVASNQVVSAQGSASTPPPALDVNFTTEGSPFGTITGTIADACNGKPIQGATLQLLVPDTTKGSATACDLTGESPPIPSNCVVVAAAATDDQGRYPAPTTPLTKVPLFPPPGVAHYNLEISAAGYNTRVVPISPGSVFCPTSRFPNSCSFTLEHGFLSGLTDLSSPNSSGQPLNALVMAEDSGTDNIESVALSTIPGNTNVGVFSISVPDAAPSADAIAVNDFDVFASVQDLFEGAPQKTSGHLIGTAATVGAPPSACATIDIPALSPMDCVGSGSVFGTVASTNPSSTSVRLSKNGVQIMETEPNSISPAPANMYNFCAPADTYLLTHYEGSAAQSSAPVALVPPPPTNTTCPSICQDPANSCLICQPTTGPTLQ